MCGYNDNERELLAKTLKGQRLVIPNMRPIFAHWPVGQNKHYPVVKETMSNQLETYASHSPLPPCVWAHVYPPPPPPPPL